MSGVDLLLVNPGGRAGSYQALASTLTAIEPPVWAGLMATYVRRLGYRVRVLDANAEGLSPEDVAEHVREWRPTLTAIVVYGHHPSASTQVMPAAGAICRAIRERVPSAVTLLVGGHVAALPEQTLRDEVCTFVATGEGLRTFAPLIEALGAAAPRWDRVPGLMYRDGDNICRGPAAPLVTDLDAEMPAVAWDLLPMERYRAHNWHAFGTTGSRSPYGALYTTLGCPYTCAFCCIQAPFYEGERAAGRTHSYRRWSPAGVLAQIDTLADVYGVRHVKLADELFVLHQTHVSAICRGLAARRDPLNIWAYARVDSIAPDLIPLLRDAGVRWLALGIESADAHVRADVDKAYAQDQIASTLDRLRDAGIHVLGNYMFGLPEDDHASMQQTLDLAVELNTPYANFYCAMAYPGSSLYARARAEGWSLPASWAGYAQLGVDTHPLPTRHLAGEDVLRFRDNAFTTYFTSPRYLSMLKATFGAGAVAEVKAMTAVPLERARLRA
jgi:radical SAM superfamily enzyme YgiQ (UPF0313 family)